MLTLQEAIDAMHELRENFPHVTAHIYYPLFKEANVSRTFVSINHKRHCVTTLDHPFDLHRLVQFSMHLLKERP